ncbi:ribosomal-protein-alanine acetyltransferase [Paucilactobacillus hokkaidonensis JCM 18461]|uniref:Ribosomal-protein-alanine acetyltransferase n=2 Tax=Paucilactobacillus hokkaidonensis TaxID=1193095 RepID=A0A0A1GYZ9_9LACO|nr:ribosomal protein S18-alanine N-acetyltransferase [Paucilactobacillus hokkaidonensis]KRO10212.1 ribosomal-protein-alanine acetyltransferase [Paucilactobacillus hokkaidonensis]BAP86228.1 ribosomal-protein-alanine acetyltransferase [Paucilactobacillus hokkaidonensis JCM 18461]
MFEKFKRWIKEGRQQRRRDEISNILELKNAVVSINGTDYFLARAQVADVPEILQVEQQVYGATPWNESAFVQEIRRQRDRLYLVVRQNDKLLGFAGCSFDRQKNEAHITNIAVTPTYQNQGIGRYLIRKLIRKAVLIDMDKMSLEVRVSNTAAQRLYKKMGFLVKNVKKRYYFGDHEDALNMVLDLNYLKGNE